MVRGVFQNELAARRLRQEGSAFLIVILLTLVVSSLGTAMLVSSNTDHQIASNERNAERALFSANAGLDYAFYLFDQGMVTPTQTGASFDSFASSVGDPLDGQAFTGKIYNQSAILNRGELYMIESTGTYNKSSRTTQLIFEIVPESFKFGYAAFSAATLHNHSGMAGPSFKLESTIFSNGVVDLPKSLTVDGTIVAAGDVAIDTGTTVTRDIFAHMVDNKGTIDGDVTTLASVAELPADEATWDLRDSIGTKYSWYNANSTAGAITNTGTISGTQSSITIADGDDFRYSIFRRNGSLMSEPNVNVTKYVPPPMIDYQAMAGAADADEATYFTSMAAAMAYLDSKKVVETIGGLTVTTIKVGTTSVPEFIYVSGDFDVQLTDDPAAEDVANGVLLADGINIEGGIYTSGLFEFHSPPFDPAVHPAPPDWYALRINALPYCWPAIIAYNEPATGTIDTWLPVNTPLMGAGSDLKMSSGSPGEGFVYLYGTTLSQDETHLHHVQNPNELIRFIGAELAWKIHNCDFLWFTYDPAVRCTSFLVNDAGTPEIVSYREVR